MDSENKVLATTQNDEETTIDLVELFYRLMDKIKIIIAATLLGAIVAFAVTKLFITPVYQATTKLYVLNSSGTTLNLSQLQLGTALASDYEQVFSNWHVHEMVRKRLNLDYTYEQLGKMVSVENPSDTRILVINVKSTDPQEAKDMALTYAQVAREFIAAKMEMDTPTIFEEPQLPEKPVSPRMLRNTALGGLLCFVLSCGMIVMQFLFDDRIRNAERLEKSLGLVTIGMMPVQKSDADTKGRRTRKEGRSK